MGKDGEQASLNNFCRLWSIEYGPGILISGLRAIVQRDNDLSWELHR